MELNWEMRPERALEEIRQKAGSAAVTGELVKILRDEKQSDYRRRCAADYLGEGHDRRAIPNLIEVLSDDFEGLRESASAALQELTGRDFGQSQEKWQAWLGRRSKGGS